jgi:hypothetical protein
MKKTFTIILQILVIALGVATVFFMFWMPQNEGRNVNATQFQIYFNDPFLAFAYIGSIAYFVGVYKVFKLLGYYRENQLSSDASVKALQTLKFCAKLIIAFVVIAEIYIMTIPSDDRAGGIAMGVFITIGSLIVLATASVIGSRIKKHLTV